MKERLDHTPPRIALGFFRWYCHPALLEEIEGDLMERFHQYDIRHGSEKARLIFVKDVLLLCRPSIIGNVNHLFSKLMPDMKTKHWLQLVLLNVIVILCMFLPFLPGRYDQFVLGLSVIAQLAGYLGLLLIPIGILWLIKETQKFKGQVSLNNWNNGYYFAITTTVITAVFVLFFIVALFAVVGPASGAVALAVVAYIYYTLFPAIRNLKVSQISVFNPTPLYLLSIPVMAFTMRMFFIGPASDFSRNYAIEQAQEVINAIESYYSEQGKYPESIDYVYHIPGPSVMGIPEFIYERNGDAYNLSFVQHQHLGATREVVMFNKHNAHNVKGHFASYNMERPYWKYYWMD